MIPGKRAYRCSNRLYNAKRVQVVIESFAHAPHLLVELFLSRMRERRMADVVAERKGFRKIFIQPQSRSHCARDLRYLNGVCQPVAKVIGNSRRKHLHFVFQPAERPRMDDAISIALKFAAVGMRKLGIAPAAALSHRKTQARGWGDQFF